MGLCTSRRTYRRDVLGTSSVSSIRLPIAAISLTTQRCGSLILQCAYKADCRTETSVLPFQRLHACCYRPRNEHRRVSGGDVGRLTDVSLWYHQQMLCSSRPIVIKNNECVVLYTRTPISINAANLGRDNGVPPIRCRNPSLSTRHKIYSPGRVLRLKIRHLHLAAVACPSFELGNAYMN